MPTPGLPSIERLASLAPVLTCPNCSRVVIGLADASQEYPFPPDVLANVSAELVNRMLYALSPCGCRVSQEWAAGFTQEIEVRRSRAGSARRVVVEFAPGRRTATASRLLAAFETLANGVRGRSETKTRWAEYNLAAFGDRILQLEPSSAYFRDSVLSLGSAVRTWVAQHCHKLHPYLAALEGPTAAVATNMGYGPDYPLPPRYRDHPLPQYRRDQRGFDTYSAGAARAIQTVDTAPTEAVAGGITRSDVRDALRVRHANAQPAARVALTPEQVESYLWQLAHLSRNDQVALAALRAAGFQLDGLTDARAAILRFRTDLRDAHEAGHPPSAHTMRFLRSLVVVPPEVPPAPTPTVAESAAAARAQFHAKLKRAPRRVRMLPEKT